jgi:hypothetical protein
VECAGLLTCAAYIYDDGGFAQACAVASGLHGPCDFGNPQTCAEGSCDPDTLTCEPFVGPGEACNPNRRDACGNVGDCNAVAPDGGYLCVNACPEFG